MTKETKIFAIVSNSENFGEAILSKVFKNFDRDNYGLESCGHIWLVKAPGWILENVIESIDKQSEAMPDGSSKPIYAVFEIKGGADGYYHNSLWEWLKAGNTND